MSFTKAAQELHLSQSAVSRQISQLEEFLGRSLFERSRGQMQLTVAGLQYAEDVRSMLNMCNEATSRVMAGNAAHTLTVACSSGIASHWLPQRISAFTKQNPDTRVRVVVRDNFRSLVTAEYDVGLYRFNEVPEATNTVRLFEERVFAVCSPMFLEEPVKCSRDLTRHRLIGLEDGERTWMSWDSWFRVQGVLGLHIEPHITANRFPVVLELAMAGQGIALGWIAIVERFLEAGLLVKASSVGASLGGTYYICWPQDSGFNPARQRFIDAFRDFACTDEPDQ